MLVVVVVVVVVARSPPPQKGKENGAKLSVSCMSFFNPCKPFFNARASNSSRSYTLLQRQIHQHTLINTQHTHSHTHTHAHTHHTHIKYTNISTHNCTHAHAHSHTHHRWQMSTTWMCRWLWPTPPLGRRHLSKNKELGNKMMWRLALDKTSHTEFSALQPCSL